MRALRGPEGCPFLGLAPMGGFLWSDEAVPDIADLGLSNASLLEALRNLAYVRDLSLTERPVDWKHLGAQELGSIYESLLEQQPEIEGNTFRLQTSQGNDRKTTGSYYTPTPLIECLMESALDPVIERALKSENPERALLGLKMCDPACGSGHFLLAAARRIAKQLASLRSGDAEPSLPAQRHALRDVVARCIYGVDINPMSVELCKVGLWLETHEPGKPLSFLDHHVLCANSLMGTRSAAIREGIPDSAYAVLGDDDRQAATALKKLNKKQREKSRQRLFQEYDKAVQAVSEAVKPLALDEMPSSTLEDMKQREQVWRAWQNSADWQKKKFLYDLWTAAFVLPRYFPLSEDGRVLPDGTRLRSETPFGVTWYTLIKFISPDSPLTSPLSQELIQAVQTAARAYQFFHMEVMFPEVAAQGGFDAVLGNPPWEHNEIKEQEWFSAHNRPDIAELSGNTRKKAIAELQQEDPRLFAKFNDDQRISKATRHFYANSMLYPLCGQGRINLYAVFAEWMRNALNEEGRLGCIVPSGIATDDTTKCFFQDMVQTQTLFSLFDFENRRKIFPAIDSRIKFCLLTSGSGAKPLVKESQFVFFAHATEDILDPERRFSLSLADFYLLNPNTRTCPICRTKKDASLTKAVYRRIPVLIRFKDNGDAINPWNITFRQGLFNMTSASHLFYTREQLEKKGWLLAGNVFEKDDERFLPLYEGKMVHHFNHRFATWQSAYGRVETRDVEPCELQDPNFCILPRYWVAEEEVRRQLDLMGWQHEWLIGWRKVCRTTDERTVIGCFFPLCAVGDSLPIGLSKIQESFYLTSILSSFICDFIARVKIGGVNFNFFLAQQLAVPSPSMLEMSTPWHISFAEWLRPRILELTYTTEDMRPFARDMGYEGDPFPWDEERRAQLRAEIDAVIFHLYLPANRDGSWKRCEQENDSEYNNLVAYFPTPRSAVEYIMETFPITRRQDVKNYGSYRTKELILEYYDAFLNQIAQP